MSEDRHSEITNLSRQSSREMPAAHDDQAALELAHKSVRPGASSPFGNPWITGGAVAAVAVIAVLLLLTVSQKADLFAPDRDAMGPSGELFNGVKKEAARPGALPADLTLTEEQLQQARSATKTRFLDREQLQALEENAQAQESRMPVKQAPALAVESPAGIEKIPGKEVIVSGQVAQPPIDQVPALAMEKSASTGVIQEKEVPVSEQGPRSVVKQASAPTVEESTSAAAMPEKEVVVSEQEPRPVVKQVPSLVREAVIDTTTAAPPLAKDEHAGTAAKAQVQTAGVSASATASAPGVKYYLQAGSFRRTARANRFKTELAGLGFTSVIKAARIEGKGTYYRVLVGPFTERTARANSKRKLAELGIETRSITDRK